MNCLWEGDPRERSSYISHKETKTVNELLTTHLLIIVVGDLTLRGPPLNRSSRSSSGCLKSLCWPGPGRHLCLALVIIRLVVSPPSTDTGSHAIAAEIRAAINIAIVVVRAVAITSSIVASTTHPAWLCASGTIWNRL